MIEEQYVSFETAKLANEKGFDEPCIRRFKNGCSQPTQQLLARWLREKHNLFIVIWNNASGYSYEIDKTDGTLVFLKYYIGPNDGGMWNSYEEAMEAGLQKALKLIK